MLIFCWRFSQWNSWLEWASFSIFSLLGFVFRIYKGNWEVFFFSVFYEFVKLELFCLYLVKFASEAVFKSSSSPVFISNEVTISPFLLIKRLYFHVCGLHLVLFHICLLFFSNLLGSLLFVLSLSVKNTFQVFFRMLRYFFFIKFRQLNSPILLCLPCVPCWVSC